MEREWLAGRLEAGASYEAIARECGRSASTVGYWAKKHRLVSTHTEKHAARGPVDESRLRELVASGLSIRAMATTLERSPTAIRHWLAKAGLQTRAGVRIAEAVAARAAKETEPVLRLVRRRRSACCRVPTAMLKSNAALPMSR